MTTRPQNKLSASGNASSDEAGIAAANAGTAAQSPSWVSGISYWQDYLTVIEVGGEVPSDLRSAS